MIKAVYPGTFDPLTRGHEDLVRRAVRLFDSLVLAIAESTAKRTFFTLDERVAMAREQRARTGSRRNVGMSIVGQLRSPKLGQFQRRPELLPERPRLLWPPSRTR